MCARNRGCVPRCVPQCVPAKISNYLFKSKTYKCVPCVPANFKVGLLKIDVLRFLKHPFCLTEKKVAHMARIWVFWT